MMSGWPSRSGRVWLGLVSACAVLVLAAIVPAITSADNSPAAKLCQKNGWRHLVRANGTSFASQDACVSDAAVGGKFGQSVAFTSTNPSPVTVGGPAYTPTATATSGLPVTITLGASSTGCSLTAGSVSFTAGGTCVIDANQRGNATWAPAKQQQQSITACISTDAQLRAVAAAGGSYCLSASAPIAVTGGQVMVGTTLSLTSSGPGNATVTAQQNSRVFSVTGSLTLKDITVTGGKAPSGVDGAGGGGVNVGATGSVVLNGQTTVTGNVAAKGGGVYLQFELFSGSGTLTMNDTSSVSGNSANPLGINVITSGGGVFVDQNATLVMNGSSRVSGNQVGGSIVSLGGGLTSNAGHVTLNGSASISANAALASSQANSSLGGGIYFVNGGSLRLNDSSSITGNSAVDSGGGIYRIDGGSGSISGVTAANVASNTPNNCDGLNSVPGCVG